MAEKNTAGLAARVPLIVSVSGIRGVVGDSLTPQVAADFAAVYGTDRAGKTVVVSRDGRSTGEMIRNATVAGLLSVGCDVVDLGIAATPTCGFLVKALGAAGGVQITASHNPPEWNGLKLYRPEGFILSPAQGADLASRYRTKQLAYVSWDRVGTLTSHADPHGVHLDKVTGAVAVEAIRKRRFRVVLDANHGSGATFGPRLLESLGCDVTVLGGQPDGRFEHPPEPTEANLGGLCSAVQSVGADVGFAVDPDADRLAIVDNTGRYIGEELTLALAIQQASLGRSGPVVVNLSTSRVSEDVATRAGCKVFRTPVGEVHVAERMIAENALIGGEGNGGVIDPRIGYIRDSAISMAVVLDLLAREKTDLSTLVDRLPRYAIRKEKFTMSRDRLPAAFGKIEAQTKDAVIDRQDGLRVDWPDAWVQLRGSNTEPIVRVIAEAKEPARAEALVKWVADLLG